MKTFNQFCEQLTPALERLKQRTKLAKEITTERLFKNKEQATAAREKREQMLAQQATQKREREEERQRQEEMQQEIEQRVQERLAKR